ncbi:amino acid ABC transporter permease [Mycolicibacterium smegmatis]|jgi:polar amino acid transport system permease protein|uniref:Amino acid ABC transporter, permease protein, 3-TM region, His/Glu/Gln/Arg/opine n=1 Tax=Mycolicibacterium smegmatis (strain MKD8) TaxID=1214915 RepID=A0A2U9Q074_MYCSE|nr:amino acid ABC transporter permease [Mycolicibacterium smegmatis]AWT57407.1 amino acid ABC transporter, permease protein, 3-TM region, His/Glu/Gln/Arg/opine [Mycolicibacterium smegmatis MKD8]MCP2625366.1 amino acid ABC transporter permease [Mycolicibacterium smegmatis]MCP2626135.1 amino acid ABC transporter permease [Mycolicibacterium smegmatis]UGU29151.1 amino acid ABC transporter permease [Mycolicibacterium smegmatis]ULN35222.1 amino acid ABC transporter permease [Mycolicibacterium smegma
MAVAEPLPIVRLRHWGRWVGAAVIVAALVLLFIALSRAQIKWSSVPDFVVYRVMVVGLVNTVLLALVAQAAAIVIGVGIALLRRSANPVARWFAAAYIWLFRGLPVLLQILIWYNLALVIPVISIPLPMGGYLLQEPTNALVSAFTAALLGLALNESAYMAEIVRAGLNSVDSGQVEAAKSIGMTPAQTLRRIVLPQAMRVIIPPTGNDFIDMLKGTSIASVIGVTELLHAANNISSNNLLVMETLFAAAIWYMVVVTLAGFGQHYLERWFGGAERSAAAQATRALRAVPLKRSARV